jgi:hypothetical protein
MCDSPKYVPYACSPSTALLAESKYTATVHTNVRLLRHSVEYYCGLPSCLLSFYICPCAFLTIAITRVQEEQNVNLNLKRAIIKFDYGMFQELISERKLEAPHFK